MDMPKKYLQDMIFVVFFFFSHVLGEDPFYAYE